jgi:hypothetical protein
VNLYGFVKNNAGNSVDSLGLKENSGALDLFLTYVGLNNSTRLDKAVMADVMNSSTVQEFIRGLLLDGRRRWKCGSRGTFGLVMPLDYFNVGSDYPMVSWSVGEILRGWSLRVMENFQLTVGLPADGNAAVMTLASAIQVAGSTAC